PKITKWLRPEDAKEVQDFFGPRVSMFGLRLDLKDLLLDDEEKILENWAVKTYTWSDRYNWTLTPALNHEPKDAPLFRDHQYALIIADTRGGLRTSKQAVRQSLYNMREGVTVFQKIGTDLPTEDEIQALEKLF